MASSCRNGEIVSGSGEAYENEAYVMEAARRFGPADAEMEWESEFESEWGWSPRTSERGALTAASRCAQCDIFGQLGPVANVPMPRASR
jgi:hypothetical protein